ncbi:MAG: hypothetical protein HC809_13060 [Gammaproteobacteria bacterium]|nr:hypothetical protein [Gammaproteobacteria bacterium]
MSLRSGVLLIALALAGALSRRLAPVLVTVFVVSVVMVAILDGFFWFEFGNRTDRLVFHYLVYPVEVATFLEEQFHLSLILVPVALCVVGAHMALRPIARGLTQLSRRVWLALLVALIVPMSVVVWRGEPGPLQPTLSRAINEAASNGLLNVIHAGLVDETRWVGIFPTLEETHRGPALRESKIARPRALAPRHVLLIIEESFAGETWWNLELRAVHAPVQ